MKLKTILIGICTLTLISIPNISAYASSIISSGVSSKYNSYLDYKVYTTDDLKFIGISSITFISYLIYILYKK